MEIKYKILSTERDGYQADTELWRQMRAHYENDVPFLRDYLLQKRSWETREEYEDRSTAFTYTPLMSSFLSKMVASMSGSPFVISANNPVIPYLEQNVDGAGQGIQDFISEVYTSLLYYGRVYTIVDFRGGIPYLTILPPETAIDQGEGWVRFRQIKTIRNVLGEATSFVRFLLFSEQETMVFESECSIKDGEIKYLIRDGKKVSLDKATLPLVAHDTHGLRSACVYYQMPEEYYLGRLLVDKQNQYSRIETAWTLSGMVAGQVIRMFTPVNRDASDPRRLDEPDYNEVKLSSQRVLVGSNFQFAESTGTAITNLTGQLNKIEQQMREITCQKMTGEANQAVSGVSKGIDAEELNTTMRSHGGIIRKYLEILMTRAALLSGYPEEVYISGFNDFELAQRDKLLETSISVGGFSDFLPLTVQKLWWTKVSKSLIGTVSPDLLQQIEAEVEGIFNEETWSETESEEPEEAEQN